MKRPIAVDTFEDISLVLGQPAFQPVDYADRHRRLADALGFDISEILQAINAIPLCLRGEAHTQSRARLARCIADAAPAIDTFVETELPQLLAVLLAPGRRDVMQAFVLPCIDKMMTCIVGVPTGVEPDAMTSRLFSQAIGVAKRKRMNTELGALRQRLTATFPDLDEQGINDRIALSVLGTDALRGTLGCSLHEVLIAGFGTDVTRQLDKIPPRTGVPYVDREAVVPCRVGGADYEAHTNFQGRLQALEGRPDQERLRFFGFGEHTCLGRRMSLQVWRAIADHIAQAAPKVTITAFSLRRDDVFTIPEDFEIEVRYA